MYAKSCALMNAAAEAAEVVEAISVESLGCEVYRSSPRAEDPYIASQGRVPKGQQSPEMAGSHMNGHCIQGLQCKSTLES